MNEWNIAMVCALLMLISIGAYCLSLGADNEREALCVEFCKYGTDNKVCLNYCGIEMLRGVMK